MDKRIEREIEDMYRKYRQLQNRLMFLQPNSTSIPNETGIHGSDNESKVERLASERADLSVIIKKIELCLEVMTKIEKDFITYRYFSELPMDEVSYSINVSRSEAYNIREKIIKKTAFILGYEEASLAV